jgi:hypothetical protein
MALPHHAAMWAAGAVAVGIGGLYLYNHASASSDDSTDTSSQGVSSAAYPLFQTAAVPQYAGGSASGASTSTAGDTSGTSSSSSGLDASTLSALVSGAAATQANQANTGLAAQLFSQFGAQQAGATSYVGDFSSVAGATHFAFTSSTATTAPAFDPSSINSQLALLNSGVTSLGQRADNQDAWTAAAANQLTAQIAINQGVQGQVGNLMSGLGQANQTIANVNTSTQGQIASLAGQVGTATHSSGAALSEINQIAGSLWSSAGVPTQWTAESKAAGNAA